MSLSPSGHHVAIISIFHFSFTFTSTLATSMTAGIAVPAPELSGERIPRPTHFIPGDFAP